MSVRVSLKYYITNNLYIQIKVIFSLMLIFILSLGRPVGVFNWGFFIQHGMLKMSAINCTPIYGSAN